MDALTVDCIAADLHTSGWSTGKISFTLGRSLYRQVDARRGEAWNITQEHMQKAAWREAWREARASHRCSAATMRSSFKVEEPS